MKPGSAITNTSSISATSPSPTLLAFTTTKGAIAGTAGLAGLVAEQGIRVSAVAPGPILTAQMNRKGVSCEADIVDGRPTWDTRHSDDGGGPLADSSSPDRTHAIGEGSLGQIDSVHGSGYQKATDSVHLDFLAKLLGNPG